MALWSTRGRWPVWLSSGAAVVKRHQGDGEGDEQAGEAIRAATAAVSARVNVVLDFTAIEGKSAALAVKRALSSWAQDLEKRFVWRGGRGRRSEKKIECIEV